MKNSFNFSNFRNRYNTDYPLSFNNMTIKLLKDMLKYDHIICNLKDNNRRRCKKEEKFISSNLIRVDVDNNCGCNCVNIKDTHAKLKQLDLLFSIETSKNNTQKINKFHVTFYLKDFITDVYQYESVAKFTIQWLENLLECIEGCIDKKTWNYNRLWDGNPNVKIKTNWIANNDIIDIYNQQKSHKFINKINEIKNNNIDTNLAEINGCCKFDKYNIKHVFESIEDFTIDKTLQNKQKSFSTYLNIKKCLKNNVAAEGNRHNFLFLSCMKIAFDTGYTLTDNQIYTILKMKNTKCSPKVTDKSIRELIFPIKEKIEQQKTIDINKLQDKINATFQKKSKKIKLGLRRKRKNDIANKSK